MDFHGYVAGIAEARFAIRKAFRIIDEQAKRRGLDPLAHQALIQIYGSAEQNMQVNDVARRLDITPPFASRLVRALDEKGYVERRSSEEDKRVIDVYITDSGRELVQEIDSAVRYDIEYFQRQLPEESKVVALSVMGVYVGLDIAPDRIREIAGLEESSKN